MGIGMITVRIGEASRPLDEATPSWINQQINRRRSDDEPICVQVAIRLEGVDFTLSTPGCGGARGTRQWSAREQEIINLWRKHRLNSADFRGGDLVAFLRQLQH